MWLICEKYYLIQKLMKRIKNHIRKQCESKTPYICNIGKTYFDQKTGTKSNK